jgi:PilZ domain
MASNNVVSLDRRRVKRPNDPHMLGRRAAERARIVLPACIRTLTGQKEVNLLNLSSTGCMIEGPGLPRIGHDVVLKSLTLELLGVVVWAGNGRCGIQFDQAIPQDEVRRHWFEGLRTARSGVTPSMRDAAKDWATGLNR